MHRRTAITSVGSHTLIALSGCVDARWFPSDDGTSEVERFTLVVGEPSDVPADAPVTDATEATLVEVADVRAAIAEAVAADGAIARTISDDAIDEVRERLMELPDHRETGYPAGQYVHYEESVVVIFGYAGSEGELTGEPIETVPPDGTAIDRDDPRVEGVEPIQLTIESVLEGMGTATVAVADDELAAAATGLHLLPVYAGNAEFPSGYYVRADEDVIVLRLMI